MAKKEYKTASVYERNIRRVILFGALAAVSLIILHSLLYFGIFAAITAANIYLTKKAQDSDEHYAEQLDRLEQLGDELTDAERDTIRKIRGRDSKENPNEQDALDLIAAMDAEDELYEAYAEAECGEGEDE